MCVEFNLFTCVTICGIRTSSEQNEIVAVDRSDAPLAFIDFWRNGSAHRGTCSLQWAHTLRKQPTDIYSLWYQSLCGLYGFGPRATFLPKESKIGFSFSVHKKSQLQTYFRLLPSPRDENSIIPTHEKRRKGMQSFSCKQLPSLRWNTIIATH